MDQPESAQIAKTAVTSVAELHNHLAVAAEVGQELLQRNRELQKQLDVEVSKRDKLEAYLKSSDEENETLRSELALWRKRGVHSELEDLVIRLEQQNASLQRDVVSVREEGEKKMLMTHAEITRLRERTAFLEEELLRLHAVERDLVERNRKMRVAYDAQIGSLKGVILDLRSDLETVQEVLAGAADGEDDEDDGDVKTTYPHIRALPKTRVATPVDNKVDTLSRQIEELSNERDVYKRQAGVLELERGELKDVIHHLQDMIEQMRDEDTQKIILSKDTQPELTTPTVVRGKRVTEMVAKFETSTQAGPSTPPHSRPGSPSSSKKAASFDVHTQTVVISMPVGVQTDASEVSEMETAASASSLELSVAAEAPLKEEILSPRPEAALDAPVLPSITSLLLDRLRFERMMVVMNGTCCIKVSRRGVPSPRFVTFSPYTRVLTWMCVSGEDHRIEGAGKQGKVLGFWVDETKGVHFVTPRKVVTVVLPTPADLEKWVDALEMVFVRQQQPPPLSSSPVY